MNPNYITSGWGGTTEGIDGTVLVEGAGAIAVSCQRESGRANTRTLNPASKAIPDKANNFVQCILILLNGFPAGQ